MGTGKLTVDLDALVANWRALDRMSASNVRTAAVVKADGYGLGVAEVGRALAKAGARSFFVAIAEEGVRLRRALGDGPEISVFSGHMDGDTSLIEQASLVPMLNSPEQLTRHFEGLAGHPFGIQLDTGMNRLGMEKKEWAAVAEMALSQRPRLVMSHLACADEPEHELNAIQLGAFVDMTEGINVPRSLSATGGILMGSAYHFDMVRPGIGLYGGMPFEAATPVVRLSLPVIQTRLVQAGEVVGYSMTWKAKHDSVIATVCGGYADGLIRHMSNKARLYAGNTACQLVGRVSMDLLTIDISHLTEVPEYLDILSPVQSVDELADAAGTIGYEILTQLGGRYARHYRGNRV